MKLRFHIEAGFCAPIFDGSNVIGLSSLLLSVPTPQIHLLASSTTTPALDAARPRRQEMGRLYRAEIWGQESESAAILLLHS